MEWLELYTSYNWLIFDNVEKKPKLLLLCCLFMAGI